VEWLISGDARRRFRFSGELFAQAHGSLEDSLDAAQALAGQMNRRRDGDVPASGGEIFALGMLHLAWRAVLDHLLNEPGTDVFNRQLGAAGRGAPRSDLETGISLYVNAFPLAAIFRGEQSIEEFLLGEPGKTANQAAILRESFLNFLGRQNPAAADYQPLFVASSLKVAPWLEPLGTLNISGDETQSPLSAHQLASLATVLLTPVQLFPNSLIDQLKFILHEWGEALGDLRQAILTALDVLAEERQQRFGGAGDSDPSGWFAQDLPGERFSPDQAWMEALVLIAKNAHVWLAQLSATYGQDIHRLDQIPDAELDRLAGFGVTGLWLIGVWERSKASRKIKQRMGDVDADASAYSVYDYVISGELGGEGALTDLRQRAMQRGIRLGSDMVPNHMAIDSRWAIEHPDRFLSLAESPFPSYTFTGPNLSDDDRVGLYLEDHYYDRSDAAVVFLRLDRRTGERRYIYHGNDGTSMPWNDTAQLNYLSAETREAVIQTILKIARDFPIIRFDAAMTLARRHIRRLWFPEPGEGGAIPSRAGRGMLRQAFDEHLPAEFWREVVERVAAHAQGTLLLAEAFWMMEGYFVRYLGLHRVYNSAFMHMLRDERNGEYRAAIKGALAGSPEVLKRFVNFLNNPDEQTAREQFGTGDKYFGITTLMATLPGLPMIGHGQLEGLAEKYGMEFRRPRRIEHEDAGLLAEHARRIFPLFRRRATFAGVENFRLYDAVNGGGGIEQDVYAYLNRHGEDVCLVLYHNRFGQVTASIHESAPFRDAAGGLRTTRLAADVGLPNEEGRFLAAYDLASGLEYLWECQAIHQHGFWFELGAYEARILQDFRVLQTSEEEPYDILCGRLNGRGVPSVTESARAVAMESLIDPFRELVNPEAVGIVTSATAKQGASAAGLNPIGAYFRPRYGRLLDSVRHHFGGADPGDVDPDGFTRRLVDLASLGLLRHRYPEVRSRNFVSASNWIRKGLRRPSNWAALLAALALQFVGPTIRRKGTDPTAFYRASGWSGAVRECLFAFGLEHGDAEGVAGLPEALMSADPLLPWARIVRPTRRSLGRVAEWFERAEIAKALGVNMYAGKSWFNKEQMERWLWLTFVFEALHAARAEGDADFASHIGRLYGLQRRLIRAVESSECQTAKFLEVLRE
jgi:glycosidase